MANELQNVLDEIKLDKDTNLLPENLKTGVTCLGINGALKPGVDTSEANATADDIIQPKTAYVNGKRIMGNITPIMEPKDIVVEHGEKTCSSSVPLIVYVPKYDVTCTFNSTTMDIQLAGRQLDTVNIPVGVVYNANAMIIGDNVYICVCTKNNPVQLYVYKLTIADGSIRNIYTEEVGTFTNWNGQHFVFTANNHPWFSFITRNGASGGVLITYAIDAGTDTVTKTSTGSGDSNGKASLDVFDVKYTCDDKYIIANARDYSWTVIYELSSAGTFNKAKLISGKIYFDLIDDTHAARVTNSNELSIYTYNTSTHSFR